MSKKVLITGSTGMLGFEILDFLKKQNKFDITLINRKRNFSRENEIVLDLIDNNALIKALEKIEPDVIVHCAALTDVNLCESETSYAYKLHVESTMNLAKYCPSAKFIYISTDSVYDGVIGNYVETDLTNPVNYYATTKLEGEDKVLKYSKNPLIIRTNLFGFHQKPLNSLFEWGIRSFNSNQLVYGFENVFFNPIYTKNLAKLVNYFINNETETGVFNFGSKNITNKYNFLDFIRILSNKPSNLIESKILRNDLEVRRPLNTYLNIEKIEKRISSFIDLDLFSNIIDCHKSYLKNENH
ncbi:MAG: SDR family oxidoreductase [Leadbetterella sp.]|nr:SDR family oxidoreductase [Leadbetterella sp.]